MASFQPQDPVNAQAKTPVVSSYTPVQENAKSNSALTWRPTYLRRRILLSFLVLFCALFASLEALNQVSRKQHGLVSAPESRRYLWTYGPTAVLTVVAAFWLRVEHQAKQSAPWINLNAEPNTARKTLLLDYVSVSQPQAFITAFRNGNFGVTVAITCSVLFKLLIIFSTGLLSLGQVDMRSDSAQLILRDSFSTSDPHAGLRMAGTLPYDILTGIIMNNLSYPEGTTAEYAFQWFSSPSGQQKSAISSIVDGFSAGLDCAPAEVAIDWILETTYFPQLEGIDNSTRIPSPFINGSTRVDSPGCQMFSRFPWLPVEIANLTNGDTTYWGAFSLEYCNNSTDLTKRGILLSVGEVVLGPETPEFDPSDPEMQMTTSTMTLQRSTSFVCYPTYSISRVLATIDTRGAETTTEIKADSVSPPKTSRINGLNPWDVAVASFDAINPFQNGTGQNFAGSDFINDYPIYPDLSFDFDKALTIGLLLQRPAQPPMDALFDATTLLDTALLFYRGIGAQLAHKSLMSGPKDILTFGSVITNENRLLIREVSLRAMEAFILVVIVLTIVLILFAPRRAIAPHKPTTIAATASIAASSPNLRSLLQYTGAMPLPSLQERLSGHKYHSSAHGLGHSPGLGILVNPDEHYIPNPTGPVVAEMANSEYHPLPMRWIVRIPLVIILIALIAALEAVLQVSKKNDGLGDVASNAYKHYIWTYIPALVMVSVGVVFASLDFSTRSIAPYSKMKSPEGATYGQSLGVNFLDQLAPITMFRSIQTRHWAVLATTVAALIGSILAIVASGLYSLQSVPQTRDIQIRENSLFASNMLDAGRDFGEQLDGIATAGLTIHGNLTDPAWTYDDLALPELSVVDSQESLPASDGLTLTATITATRSNFTCRIWENDKFEANLTWGPQRGFAGDYENLLYVIIPEELYRPIRIATPAFYQLTPLYMGVQPNSFFGMGWSETRAWTATSSNYSYMWGEIGTMDQGIKHLSVMTCNETLEEVDALTTFHYPGFQIDRSHPPIPDESTRRPSNSFNPLTSYEFLPNISSTHSFDKFFSAVVYGKTGIPAEELGLESAQDNVVKTITHMHKIVRTQQNSNVTRIPTNSTTSKPPFNATLTNPDRLRLVQDPASTRALEALLATMLLLAIAASLLMPRSKSVLPKNPCSIAAVMSLLADSEMLDAVAHDPEILERSGWRFRLGWFEKGDGNMQDSGVDALGPKLVDARSAFGIEAFVPH